MGKHFGGVLDNSMQNGLQMNLKDAIEDVGVKVPNSACLWQYPEIIRKNLIANTLTNVNLRGGDVIHITSTSEDNSFVYDISTKYDTYDVSRPNYATGNGWDDEMSVDKVFDDLFKNILPAVRGVHAGDMTTTDGSGTDTKTWTNTLFDISGTKTGLQPSSKYLRLYLTCQAEPIYIYTSSAVSDLTNGYNVQNSDTVSFELNQDTMTMKAHISCITSEQINKII